MGTELRTILVVDDYEPHRYAAKRLLEAAGFAVVTAATGHDALSQASRHPDLILLDVGLPDLTGFDVCRMLKHDPATKLIPVVFMSASHTDASAVDLGTQAGANAFLFHPATREELLSVVAGSIAKANGAWREQTPDESRRHDGTRQNDNGTGGTEQVRQPDPDAGSGSPR